MTPQRPRGPPQIIDLTSDADETADEGTDKEEDIGANSYPIDPISSPPESSDQGYGFEEPPFRPANVDSHVAPNSNGEAFNWPLEFDREWEAILAAPDIDAAPDINATFNVDERDVVDSTTSSTFTEQDCLTKVLELFPDIAHDHVLQLYRGAGNNGMNGRDWYHRIVETILENPGSYPKERERKEERKRKRESLADEDEDLKLYGKEREISTQYVQHAHFLLSEEFNEIPVQHIRETLRKDKTLFRAFETLNTQQHTLEMSSSKPYSKVRPRPRKVNSMKRDMAHETDGLLEELRSAKRKQAKDDARRKSQMEKERFEAENEKLARDSKSLAECGCCFTEFPLNRMATCNGDVAHFFCFDCCKRNVEAEIGNGKCRPKCMDTSGCSATYLRTELLKALKDDMKLLEKLEQMQQLEDIRLAGLEDLEGCPFCDFQAICLPVEIDREFRCENKDCERVSCRLCKLDSHVPKSCDEFARDNKASHRHRVEEAMTDALTRTCNKCKNKFLKDYGCNKITCPTCGNKQCYVCGKNITDYDHFNHNTPNTPVKSAVGKCPLYDNTEERHQKEVKDAEKAALAQLRNEDPDLTEEDLKIKVSDRVMKAEQHRVAQAQQRVGGAVPMPPLEDFHHLHHPHHPHDILAGGVDPFAPFLHPPMHAPAAGIPVPRQHHHIHHHHHHVVPPPRRPFNAPQAQEPGPLPRFPPGHPVGFGQRPPQLQDGLNRDQLLRQRLRAIQDLRDERLLFDQELIAQRRRFLGGP